jgi:hypothetical protein
MLELSEALDGRPALAGLCMVYVIFQMMFFPAIVLNILERNSAPHWEIRSEIFSDCVLARWHLVSTAANQ